MNIDKYILSEKEIAVITWDTSGNITPNQCLDLVMSLPADKIPTDNGSLLEKILYLAQWAYLRGYKDAQSQASVEV